MKIFYIESAYTGNILRIKANNENEAWTKLQKRVGTVAKNRTYFLVKSRKSPIKRVANM